MEDDSEPDDFDVQSVDEQGNGDKEAPDGKRDLFQIVAKAPTSQGKVNTKFCCTACHLELWAAGRELHLVTKHPGLADEFISKKRRVMGKNQKKIEAERQNQRTMETYGAVAGKGEPTPDYLEGSLPNLHRTTAFFISRVDFPELSITDRTFLESVSNDENTAARESTNLEDEGLATSAQVENISEMPVADSTVAAIPENSVPGSVELPLSSNEARMGPTSLPSVQVPDWPAPLISSRGRIVRRKIFDGYEMSDPE